MLTDRADITSRAIHASFVFSFWMMKRFSFRLWRGIRHSANYFVTAFRSFLR